MGILSLLLLLILILCIATTILMLRNSEAAKGQVEQHITYVKAVGLFTLMFGLLAQLLGLYGALSALEVWGSVTPAVLAQGLWTSSIPSIYGLMIFLLALVFGRVGTYWLRQTKRT